MVDEGYHTHANLRALIGMPADPGPPTNANLTIWVDMVDAVIESYDTTPNEGIAQAIELNRIEILYNLRKKTLSKEPWKKSDPLAVEPLTEKEEKMLDGADDYDSVIWE